MTGDWVFAASFSLAAVVVGDDLPILKTIVDSTTFNNKVCCVRLSWNDDDSSAFGRLGKVQRSTGVDEMSNVKVVM